MNASPTASELLLRLADAATTAPEGGQLMDNELFVLLVLLGSFVGLMVLALAISR